MSENPPNSKKLRLVSVTNHCIPVTEQLTAESQFGNMPSGWQD